MRRAASIKFNSPEFLAKLSQGQPNGITVEVTDLETNISTIYHVREHHCLHALKRQRIHVLWWVAFELWDNFRLQMAENACSEAEVRGR